MVQCIAFPERVISLKVCRIHPSNITEAPWHEQTCLSLSESPFSCPKGWYCPLDPTTGFAPGPHWGPWAGPGTLCCKVRPSIFCTLLKRFLINLGHPAALPTGTLKQSYATVLKSTPTSKQDMGIYEGAAHCFPVPKPNNVVISCWDLKKKLHPFKSKTKKKLHILKKL